MITRRLLILALILILAGSARTGRAEPIYTDLVDAMAQSETIAVVALTKPVYFRSSEAEFEVRQVIKGSWKPGKHRVSVDSSHLSPAGEFVAFVDAKNEWRFIAVPISGKPADWDVLSICGFFSHNAHLVTPGLVTTAQLRTYVASKSLRYAFRGNVYFPNSGKPGWQASRLELSGTYDAIAKTAQVKGFPALAIFPTQPEVRVWSHRDDHSLTLEYRKDGDRRLEFRGTVVGWDSNSGGFLVKFAVSEPALLTANALNTYLGNPRPTIPIYRLRLKCAPSGRAMARELTLVMGEEQGTIGQIYGWADHPLEIEEGSYSGKNSKGLSQSSGYLRGGIPIAVENVFADDWVLRLVAPTGSGEFLVLAFALGEPPHEAIRRDRSDELLYRVWQGLTRGTLQIHDGKTLKTIAPFTATVDPVEFVAKRHEGNKVLDKPSENGAFAPKIPVQVDFVEYELSPMASIGILVGAAVIFAGIFIWLVRRKPTKRDRTA
jgi:hypothetical protein